MLKTLGTAAAVTLALGVATVQAEPQTDITGALVVHVRYDDLNLASPDGAKTLYRRIRAAAKEVCPQGGPQEDLTRYAISQTCQSQAIERAVHEVHDPRLAALHEKLGKG
jgi:UrcA family protein